MQLESFFFYLKRGVSYFERLAKVNMKLALYFLFVLFADCHDSSQQQPVPGAAQMGHLP